MKHMESHLGHASFVTLVMGAFQISETGSQAQKNHNALQLPYSLIFPMMFPTMKKSKFKLITP